MQSCFLDELRSYDIHAMGSTENKLDRLHTLSVFLNGYEKIMSSSQTGRRGSRVVLFRKTLDAVDKYSLCGAEGGLVVREVTGIYTWEIISIST